MSTTSQKLNAAIADSSCEAELLNILSDHIVMKFNVRFNFPGCSIERAAQVSENGASPEAFRLARAKLVASIESGWGRDAADRWEKILKPIWG